MTLVVGIFCRHLFHVQGTRSNFFNPSAYTRDVCLCKYSSGYAWEFLVGHDIVLNKQRHSPTSIIQRLQRVDGWWVDDIVSTKLSHSNKLSRSIKLNQYCIFFWHRARTPSKSTFPSSNGPARVPLIFLPYLVSRHGRFCSGANPPRLSQLARPIWLTWAVPGLERATCTSRTGPGDQYELSVTRIDYSSTPHFPQN